MSIRRLKYGDWSMPDPLSPGIKALMHKARYSHDRLTKMEIWELLSLAEAYVHFAAHPAGTEAMVKQLRQLRRTVKEEYAPLRESYGKEA